MKLLFDQNPSPKLVSRLAELFPDSSHVQIEGLDCERRSGFVRRSRAVIRVSPLDEEMMGSGTV